MARRTTSTQSDPHSARLKRLRARMRREGHDALLITIENDIRYLTGFSGEDSCAIVTPKAFILVSDFRFAEELEPFKRRVTLLMRSKPMAGALADAIRDLRPSSLAVQAEHITASLRSLIAKAAGARKTHDSVGLVADLRIIKDDAEIRTIRKAARIQEQAMEATLAQIGVGWREDEIAALLEYEMRTRGASGTSFNTNVSARANGSKPHYRAGRTTTAAGRPLLIDWGAKYEGYCADMTRVFSFGRWAPKMREIYEIVLEAHLAAIDATAPGKTCAEVDLAARSIIENAGLGDRFGHGLGHGIGLDIHEAPRLARGQDTVLKPGMVVTIEPGIYLPGIGGVRIEDDIVITERGRRNLCTLPKDLSWATLHG